MLESGKKNCFYTKDELDDFKDAVDECSKTVADMINNDSFTGATADSVKSYLSDVHITLLASMKTLAQNMQDQVALYKAGYYGIDNKTDFILGEEAINSYKTCLDTQLSRLAEREGIVNGAIDSIADLISFKKPSTEGIYTAHQALNTEMDTLKEVTPLYWCKLNRATGSSFRYNVKRQSNILPRRKNHGSTQYYIESGRNTTTT